MYLILAVITPGVIDVWEGFLTFMFFPTTVFTAWIADIKIIQTRFVPRRYRRTSHGLIATEDDTEMKAIEGDGLAAQAYKLIPKVIIVVFTGLRMAIITSVCIWVPFLSQH